VYGTDIENPDYSMIAKAYGIPSYKVSKTKEFQQHFDKAIKSEKGAIIEIILDIQSISPYNTLNEIKMKTCNSV
jgi:Thiamine pyrophosphate-requiring enzymes [acetolactate synthase, pyruvate dehydrogenase (cytochrome), glyoxylate carboligase, phosphonopyruvate decarboxylase]